MNTNYKFFLEEFLKIPLEAVVFCPGSRNSALMRTLSAALDKTPCYHFFDERAAGFFALGLAKARKKAVAVLVTSGTAVAELLPAVIEAHYSELPLVVLCCDAPEEYRGSGAPQCIDQSEIFSSFVEGSYDLKNLQDLKAFNLKTYSLRNPLHINICCAEDEGERSVLLLEEKPKHYEPILSEEDAHAHEEVLKFLSKAEKPLFLAGALTQQEARKWAQVLEHWKIPFWADVTSHLLGIQKIQRQCVREELWLKEQRWTHVLRVGSVPSCRIWRDLSLSLKELPVLNLTKSSFSGLARSSVNVKERLSVESLKTLYNLNTSFEVPQKESPHFFRDYPRSEPSLLRAFSESLSNEALIYLGNSLPLREWNRFAEVFSGQQYFASRGANGIDGQLSTFMGLAESFPEQDAFAVVGDLTALYDSNALALLAQLKRQKAFHIVVINNQGGRIFERLPRYADSSETFLEQMRCEARGVSFKAWAEAWSFAYNKISVLKDWEAFEWPDQSSILELKVDNEQSREFLKLWSEAQREKRNA